MSPKPGEYWKMRNGEVVGPLEKEVIPWEGLKVSHTVDGLYFGMWDKDGQCDFFGDFIEPMYDLIEKVY